MTAMPRSLFGWIAAGLLLAMPAHAAEVTVLTAGAFRSVVAAMVPTFEARTGDKVVLQNDTTGGLLRRIAAGETFDVVVLPPSGLEQLASSGQVVTGSGVRLAKVGIGIGVNDGAAKPDVATVEAFKAAVLGARAVAIVDPASGGSSGIYLTKLFQTLGIAPNLVLVPGGLAAEAVADGRAEMAVQQISEITVVPGVRLAGPLPNEIQNFTIYAGAISANAASPAAARSLLDLLAGPATRPILLAKGMDTP